jgi:hypothetical protein
MRVIVIGLIYIAAGRLVVVGMHGYRGGYSLNLTHQARPDS